MAEVSKNILNIQVQERMQYKATQLAEMKNTYEKEWTIRIEEACMSGVRSMRHFLGLSDNTVWRKVLKVKLSSEARNALDKEIRYVSCVHAEAFCLYIIS